jgi:hypothetical protein
MSVKINRLARALITSAIASKKLFGNTVELSDREALSEYSRFPSLE